jgi:hypothetical protein
MARSGPKGGRPRKWPAGTNLKQIHIDAPTDLVEEFRAAAEARGLALVDWLIVLGSSAIGKPAPLPIQERMPLNDAA